MNPTSTPRNPLLVVGLGESLFDCFPNRRLLGGAPVNVAVHANALLSQVGGQAVAATRVGNDELGEEYLDEVGARGLDASAVQVDRAHPTGTVTVEIGDQGHASYDFASNVAWDHFELNDNWQSLAKVCHAVAFGTLAQRSAKSREVIAQFLQTADQAFRLFDVNLRGDFYSLEVIKHSLNMATAVKLNEDELPIVCDLLDLCDVNSTSVDEQAEQVRSTFGLSWVALTRGPRGTALYDELGGDEQGGIEGEPVNFPKADNADTVGAGDACCSALLVGQLLGWEGERTVRLANQMGAFVASQPGATPQIPEEILTTVSDGE